MPVLPRLADLAGFEGGIRPGAQLFGFGKHAGVPLGRLDPPIEEVDLALVGRFRWLHAGESRRGQGTGGEEQENGTSNHEKTFAGAELRRPVILYPATAQLNSLFLRQLSAASAVGARRVNAGGKTH